MPVTNNTKGDDNVKIIGVSKLREVGGSLGIILPKSLFKDFDVKKGEDLVIKYDEVNKKVIIEKN